MNEKLKKVLDNVNRCTCNDNLPFWAMGGYDSKCPLHGIEKMYETSPMVRSIVDKLAEE